MSFNKVILLGNLTRDPEVRTLPSGASVARLSLACNRVYFDKEDNKKEEVTYVDVDAFGKQADVVGKHFTKGKPILVEGRLRLDQWEDKTTGEKKSRLSVVMESFSFAGDAAPAGSRAAPATHDATGAPRRQAPARAAAPKSAAPADAGDEDVPC